MYITYEKDIYIYIYIYIYTNLYICQCCFKNYIFIMRFMIGFIISSNFECHLFTKHGNRGIYLAIIKYCIHELIQSPYICIMFKIVTPISNLSQVIAHIQHFLIFLI